jgi:hypothetical protein
MRTLNRPMFRYGGPIKEGVMNGIREPKKDGGSMGEPQATYGVGNNMNRDASGREKHAFFLPALYAAGAAGLRMAARPFGKYVAKQFARPDRLSKTGKIIKSQVGKGGGIGPSTYLKTGKPGEGIKTFNPNAVGRYFRDSPEANLITGAGGAISRGIYNTGKYAVKSPLTVASAAGFGGKKLYDALNAKPDKKDPAGVSEINKLKRSIGMPENLTLGGGQNIPDIGERELSEEEKAAAVTDARKKQMDIYKEIMDIKGMKKDATYKALIDASQLITAEGDFKGSIKDGSLISKLIGAADKRFDKVSDTETALRSLVAKGEIDKIANKDKYELEKRKTNLQIKAAEKTLAGASLGETANAVYEKTGKFPTGKNLANVARTKGIEVVGIEDTAAVDEWIGENGGDEIAYMEDVIKRGADVAPGPHVLRSRIIIVDSEGNVSPFF